jgi:hypothetical protein
LLPWQYQASKLTWQLQRRCLSPISAVDEFSIHGSPQTPPSSRAWSSHSSDPRDLRRASDPARLYRTRHEPSTTALASRCRHCHPRVANRIGADFASCSLEAPSLSGARLFLSGHYPCGRCKPLHEPRQLDYWHPFRSPNHLRLPAGQLEQLEPFPHAMRQHHGFLGSGTPFTH